MSGEQEILRQNIELFYRLNGVGFTDFKTSELNDQFNPCNINNSFSMFGRLGSHEDENFEMKPLVPVSITSKDYDNLITIFNSKLLFLEDFQFVESLLSTFNIEDGRIKQYFTYGALATSFISTAVCLKKANSYFSWSFAVLCSIYSTWKVYKNMSEMQTNQVYDDYIKSLQKLCVNFQKIFRFLKETVILFKGQVSTSYIQGYATYIPVNSGNELTNHPSWKIFYDLEKVFVNSLIDVFNIFSLGWNVMKKHTPLWMNIDGFSLPTQISSEETNAIFNKIHNADGCFSVKELQYLLETYLLAQSEFLKWVALYSCPTVWHNSNETVNSFMSELLKFFRNSKPKLSNLSLQLELEFNVKSIFSSQIPKEITVQINPEISSFAKELEGLQVQLHEIFLFILSTVQKAKTLEDYLEGFANKSPNEDYVYLKNFKGRLSQEVNDIKSDLAQVIKDYDSLRCQLFSNKKFRKACKNLEIDKNTDTLSNPFQPQEDGSAAVRVGFSNLTVSSGDDVFLGISGSKTDNFDSISDDWCLVNNQPKIPKSLLSELSTTLKPIRKDCKEREKLVLERLGLQDQSDHEDKENSEGLLPVKAGFSRIRTKVSSKSNVIVKNSSSSSENDDIPVHSENHLLMANLMKMSSPTRQKLKLEESFFSN